MDLSGISFLTVKFGERVSLNCFVKANSIDRVLWFKQMIGAMPQKVGERATYKEIKISPEFETSGFLIETLDNAVSLTIPRIKREDGGLYFCGILSWVNFTLSNGTFLAVTGNELNLFCTI